MKRSTVIIITILISTSLFAQTKPPLFLNSKSVYYQSTDFSKVDTLDSWFYVLVDKNLSYEDPIKPIGQLIFQRKKTVKGWTANFTFQIFNIKDSAYCFRKSKSVRDASSCMPPNVAGDIIIVNQYIFLNTNVCLQCKNPENGLDYCRPVINKLFSGVNKTNLGSLEGLVKQFPIDGQVMKLPY